MAKKDISQIKNYYKKGDVVKTYDQRRFAQLGGQYINTQEIAPFTEFIRKTKKKSVTVLDLGAGRGRLSLPIKDLNCKVYCLDASREMLDTLKPIFKQDQLILQSIFEPLKNKLSYDFIVSLRFFDHFNIADQKRILFNITKHLKNDGYILFASLNKKSLESLVSSFFPYGRYNYFYTDAQYRELFRKMGLKVTTFNSRFFLPRGIFLKINKFSFAVGIFTVIDTFFNRLFPMKSAFFFYALKKN